MGKRCRICGLLDATGVEQPNRMCYMCQGAYQRFKNDSGWGTKTVGGFRTVRGKLVYDGPLKEVPNKPSGNWFRYIVRERLLRGLNRYPYVVHQAREANPKWNPDKMPPWDDVHTIPWDLYLLPVRQGIVLGIVDIPHEEPAEPEGYIGPWAPPTEVQ